MVYWVSRKRYDSRCILAPTHIPSRTHHDESSPTHTNTSRPPADTFTHSFSRLSSKELAVTQEGHIPKSAAHTTTKFQSPTAFVVLSVYVCVCVPFEHTVHGLGFRVWDFRAFRFGVECTDLWPSFESSRCTTTDRNMSFSASIPLLVCTRAA